MDYTTPAAKCRIIQLSELPDSLPVISDTCTYTFKKCHSCISHSSWSKERRRPTRFPLASPSPQTARDDQMINNMKSVHLHSLAVFCFIFLFVLKVCSPPILFLFVCFGQALRSQNGLHRESDWRQSVRLQASTEEDLPEEKAHQAALNSWAFFNLQPDAAGLIHRSFCRNVWNS